MKTFIVHERRRFTPKGERSTCRIYCLCGSGLRISAALHLADTAVEAFIQAHQGPECGNATARQARQAAARRELSEGPR